MKPSIFLIDGHSQLYRAFYAIESLRSPTGRPTGAAYGFTRMLLDLINRQQPEAIIAVFDAPGTNFRHTEFPDYKATRKPTPPELIEQISVVKDILSAYNIPVYSISGYEADDVLGTLAQKAIANNWEAVIVSTDKDCGQLLQPGIKIFDSQKDIYIDEATFTNKKGFPPSLLTDVMGLWGDSVDNIPGVPGIGEKIATQLIQRYGSLENLLDHADEITGKRGEVLRSNKDKALLSKKLATIVTDLPIDLDFSQAKITTPDFSKLEHIFTELGFNSLLKQLSKDNSTEKPIASEPIAVSYYLVDDSEKFLDFLSHLQQQELIAIDTETTSPDPMNCELVGISISWQEGVSYYLPFKGPLGSKLLPLNCLNDLKTILESNKIAKSNHNIKFDAMVLSNKGINLQGITFDTMIASSLVNAGSREHSLSSLSQRYFQIEMTDIKELIGTGKKQTTMDLVPIKDVLPYAAADADISLRLTKFLSSELAKENVADLFNHLELPLSLVLTDMQTTGIRIDSNLLSQQSKEASHKLEELTQNIYSLVGHSFNIASPKQLSTILFEEMQLPVIKKTATGFSTDEEVLTELASTYNNSLAKELLTYRMYAKLKNTYLDALPQLVNPKTGRIHTSFSQTRTATGRLSSSDPNLQNIPIKTNIGRAIRAAFIPKDGWKMISADYSQVELRILAHFADDPVLKESFANNMDIHKVVASEINGIPLDSVTADQRSAAKAVNFGIIYGQGAHGLSIVTGMTRFDAQKFIDNYFSRFPNIRDWINKTVAEAREKGYVKTILGRKREIPDLKSTNKSKQARGDREAVNTIIQGSAADLIKTAMVSLHRKMKFQAPSAKMLLQIHDELLFESPISDVEALTNLIKSEMESALPLTVSTVVDIGIGDNWLETK